MAECIRFMHAEVDVMPFVLIADSNGLYSTITTSHESSDHRLRPAVPITRGSCVNGEIGTAQWMPEKKKLADALTKRTIEISRYQMSW